MTSVDRRVRRSRRLLREALLELILEQGYDSITIQNITDRADLSRATFYLHYKDKDDLLAESLEAMFDDLIKARFAELTPEKILTGEMREMETAFDHAAEHSALYKAMLSERGVAYVVHRIRAYLAQAAQHHITLLLPENAQPRIPVEVVAQHFAGSLFSLIIWWLENDMPYPPKTMAAMFRELVLPTATSALDIRLPLAPESAR